MHNIYGKAQEFPPNGVSVNVALCVLNWEK